MIVNALLVVCLLITLGSLIWGFIDDGFLTAILFGFVGFLISAVVALVLVGVLNILIPSDHHSEELESKNLRALGTGSAIEGRSYFLGSGYIGEERVLNYVYEAEDGALYIRKEYASEATLYERVGAQPQLTETDHWEEKPALFGGRFNQFTSSVFEIPEGSVLENYAITNE